jgi:hypothetical protein
MIEIIEPGRYFHISGQNPDEIQEGIDTAVGYAVQHAQAGGWEGILISRHAPDSFTVAISSHVPFGVISESDAEQETMAVPSWS